MNTWIKALSAYGSGGLMIFAGILHALNVTIPGVTWSADPVTMIGGGLGIIAAYSKAAQAHTTATDAKDTAQALMLFLGAVFASGWLFLASPALAGDVAPPRLAVASPTASCTVASCTGFFAGANLANAGGTYDVLGGGLNGLASNGVMFGAQAGYEFYSAPWFARALVIVDYEFAANDNLPGGGNSGRYALGGIVNLGYSLSDLFGIGANTGAALTVPQKLLGALMSPYVNLGVWRRPWGTGMVTGAGFQALVANGWTLNADYYHVNYNNAAFNPIVAQQSENLFMFSLNRHFGAP